MELCLVAEASIELYEAHEVHNFALNIYQLNDIILIFLLSFILDFDFDLVHCT
jgi:hypothetical protein